MQSLFLSRTPPFSAFSVPFLSVAFSKQRFMGYAGGRRGRFRPLTANAAAAVERVIQPVQNPTPQQVESLRMASRMAHKSHDDAVAAAQTGGGSRKRRRRKSGTSGRKRRKRSKSSLSTVRFRSLLKKITKSRPRKRRRK